VAFLLLLLLGEMFWVSSVFVRASCHVITDSTTLQPFAGYNPSKVVAPKNGLESLKPGGQERIRKGRKPRKEV